VVAAGCVGCGRRIAVSISPCPGCLGKMSVTSQCTRGSHQKDQGVSARKPRQKREAQPSEVELTLERDPAPRQPAWNLPNACDHLCGGLYQFSGTAPNSHPHGCLSTKNVHRVSPQIERAANHSGRTGLHHRYSRPRGFANPHRYLV
jgi:hypothetical protein